MGRHWSSEKGWQVSTLWKKIINRFKKKRTKKQLKASRDESYGKFGSKAKKSGKINK